MPFAVAGTGLSAVVERPFTEEAAAESDLHIARGCELMEFFIKAQ